MINRIDNIEYRCVHHGQRSRRLGGGRRVKLYRLQGKLVPGRDNVLVLSRDFAFDRIELGALIACQIFQPDLEQILTHLEFLSGKTINPRVGDKYFDIRIR